MRPAASTSRGSSSAASFAQQLLRDRAGVAQVPQPRDRHQDLPPGEDLVHRGERPRTLIAGGLLMPASTRG
jgi:hypothetical protein